MFDKKVIITIRLLQVRQKFRLQIYTHGMDCIYPQQK